MVGLPIEKRCSKCEEMRPFETGFYIDRRSKDGRSHTCIICANMDTLAALKRRATEPMSLRAEAMRKLYTARFRVIKRAKLPMDEEGISAQNRIDRLLKKHGLIGEIRSNYVQVNS